MTPTSDLSCAPLSFGQEQWWLLDQIEPGNTGNNVAFPLRLSGAIDLDAIERIGNQWRRRHATLRTRIRRHDGELQQVILPYQPEPLAITDLSTLPEGEREAVAQRLTTEDAQQVFDLSINDPIRLRILRLSDDDHIWLRTIHHVACDGWSVNILLREASTYYNAFIAEPSPEKRAAMEESILPDLPLTYGEYSHRQRSDSSVEEGLKFWKQRLRGIEKLSPLVLKPEHTQAVPPVRAASNQPLKHQRHSVNIDPHPELIADLKAFCQQHNVTFFTTLLAAFSTVLHRISGEEDFVIGTGTADRSRRDTRDMVGFLVGTLALRHNLSGDPTFLELLERERGLIFEVFAHGQVPFRRLVEELTPTRGTDGSLMFQTLVVAVPPSQDHPLGDLVKLPWKADTGGAIRGLLLQIKQSPEGLGLRFDYDSDYFDRAFIELLAARYLHLLERLQTECELPLSQMSLSPASERATLAQWSSGPVVEWNGPATLQELVAEQAARTPNAVALETSDGSESLTYSQLEQKAEAVASHLKGLGITRQERIAVCLERSPALLIATLGALGAGGAVVPLDTSYPPARLQAICTDAAPRALLTSRALAEKLDFGVEEENVVFLEELPLTSESAGPNVKIAVQGGNAEELAYILYTSGSTGTPKGVAMPQRGLVNLTQWQIAQSQEYSGATPRTLQFAPLNFDVAWQEIFSTWGAGGTLVLADNDARRDPDALLAMLGEKRIERLFLPFVALQQLAGAFARRGLVPDSLREVIIAGEQLLITPQVRTLFKQLPSCVLHNHYGPTETHVVTFETLQGDSENWPERPTIGRPIANARVAVVDAKGEIVPIGIAGEIEVSGTPVAHGYWNQPELTAEKFAEDKHYRTGDLARWRHDGKLEFLGRGDEQIKVRGYRVEPGEIENALLRHPAIAEVAVTAVAEKGADSGSTRLTGYFVLTPGSERPETKALRTFLGDILPEYMIPAAFVALQALPLTASGKIDRRALEHAPRAVERERVFASVNSSTFGTFEDGKL